MSTGIYDEPADKRAMLQAAEFARLGFLVRGITFKALADPEIKNGDFPTRRWKREDFPDPTPVESLDNWDWNAIAGLWVRMPDNWVLLDLDNAEADAYWRTRLGDQLIRKAAISKAPNGRGRHLWFLLEDGAIGANWSSPDGVPESFDVRGMRGGGARTVPTPHHAGGEYRWLRRLSQAVPLTAEEAELLHKHDLATGKPKTVDTVRSAGEVKEAERDTKYGLAAVRGEVDALRTAGKRNIRLNEAAYNLGQLIKGGELREETVRRALIDTALEIGLDVDEIEPTVNSGIESAEPRNVLTKDALHRVEMFDGAQIINDLALAINGGAIPDLFTSSGALVLVSDVHGDPTLPVGQVRKGVQPVDGHTLGAQMAQHVEVFVTVKSDDGKPPEEKRKQPHQDSLRQVLARRSWSGVRPLRGITRVPVLRVDGTILNTKGYDESSGLYYDPRHDFPDLPLDPSQAETEEARTFLLDQLIADFPFATPADKANYVALLATPPLRRYITGPEGVQPTPLGVIGAHTAGTGKTLLADLILESYGGDKMDFVDDENELRKVVTALLRDTNGAVALLDNVGDGHQIRSALLASLLTSGTWSGRILGQSNKAVMANDQLWITTGNNIRLGGDIASRALMVNVDSGEERPDLRGNFVIPNLDTWIKSSVNQAKVVRCMLILARAWVAAGAARIETRMRNYSDWASAMAGFLDFHKIPDFLKNADKAFEADTTRQQWQAFLGMWHQVFKDKWVSVSDVLKSGHLGWGDAFLLVDVSTGKDISVVKAGNKLREKVGTPLNGLVLQSMKPGGRNSNKSNVYRVVPHQKPENSTGGV